MLQRLRRVPVIVLILSPQQGLRSPRHPQGDTTGAASPGPRLGHAHGAFPELQVGRPPSQQAPWATRYPRHLQGCRAAPPPSLLTHTPNSTPGDRNPARLEKT